MKKEEYLRKALLLVSNPYTKAQVQRELEDHIEDEISFYTDAGYERKKAENMAMSRMGAPEEMARELGRLHRNLPGRVLGFSALGRAGRGRSSSRFCADSKTACPLPCRYLRQKSPKPSEIFGTLRSIFCSGRNTCRHCTHRSGRSKTSSL